MKQSRFSEQQIAFILHQAEEGVAVEDVCRKAGISIQTYYRWRKKYGGLMPSEMKRLKLLEEENTRLKKLVADLSLDKAMLQDVVKESYEACSGPELVEYLRTSYRISIRRACGASFRSFDLPLPASSSRAGQSPQAYSRAVRSPRQIRPSAHPCPAATGGMDHQPQVYPASVSRGGPAIAKEIAEAKGVGKAAGGSRRGYGRQ